MTKLCAPMVIGFKEYRSPMTGELISDRKKEREHMKQHDVIPAAELRKPKKLKNERFIKKYNLGKLAE